MELAFPFEVGLIVAFEADQDPFPKLTLPVELPSVATEVHAAEDIPVVWVKVELEPHEVELDQDTAAVLEEATAELDQSLLVFPSVDDCVLFPADQTEDVKFVPTDSVPDAVCCVETVEFEVGKEAEGDAVAEVVVVCSPAVVVLT